MTPNNREQAKKSSLSKSGSSIPKTGDSVQDLRDEHQRISLSFNKVEIVVKKNYNNQFKLIQQLNEREELKKPDVSLLDKRRHKLIKGERNSKFHSFQVKKFSDDPLDSFSPEKKGQNLRKLAHNV